MQVFGLKKFFFVRKCKILALRDRCFFDMTKQLRTSIAKMVSGSNPDGMDEENSAALTCREGDEEGNWLTEIIRQRRCRT